MADDTQSLTQLGSKHTEYPTKPDRSILECFPNQFPHRNYLITHKTNELTSLCPKTGQPDFATLRIAYIADKRCVETKSLKLYLFSFRNEGSFMETITNRILEDLVAVLSPRSISVNATFNARGGITTEVEAYYRADQ